MSRTITLKQWGIFLTAKVVLSPWEKYGKKRIYLKVFHTREDVKGETGNRAGYYDVDTDEFVFDIASDAQRAILDHMIEIKRFAKEVF